jgi:hypothetical protein
MANDACLLDTESVLLNMEGGALRADSLIDPDPLNLLSIRGSGMFVAGVDPSAGNLLARSVGGVYVRSPIAYIGTVYAASGGSTDIAGVAGTRRYGLSAPSPRIGPFQFPTTVTVIGQTGDYSNIVPGGGPSSTGMLPVVLYTRVLVRRFDAGQVEITPVADRMEQTQHHPHAANETTHGPVCIAGGGYAAGDYLEVGVHQVVDELVGDGSGSGSTTYYHRFGAGQMLIIATRTVGE